MQHASDRTAKAPLFGPVRKLRWLVGASGKHQLSRAELATLIVITDHVNTNTGVAWPAFARIAEYAGITVRTAKRAVAKLRAMDLVITAQSGGPGRSNRYCLNWALFEQNADGALNDTMQSTMVSSAATNGDNPDTKMVTHSSPNPINLSEQEAKDKIDRSQAECPAAPPRLGASGLPHTKGYERFWVAWGRRITVAETERLIDAKIEEGHTLDDIVAGVQRFQKYCADTAKPARMKPAAFVHGEKWRDDWKLHRGIAVQKKSKIKQTKNKKGVKGNGIIRSKPIKNPWIWNPSHLEWDEQFRAQIGILLKRHKEDFPSGGASSDAQIKRLKQLMKPWNEANPEPPHYYNKITGETWGTRRDPQPAPDWRPSDSRGQ